MRFHNVILSYFYNERIITQIFHFISLSNVNVNNAPFGGKLEREDCKKFVPILSDSNFLYFFSTLKKGHHLCEKEKE